ncbi:MAG: RHS repeat-associated core domain-containing protein [Verrucomicrobiae bacterium]|nr:RHS repeat-associated core domain-containing protein [Verrucomicrobiae bacterium]
MIAEVEEVTGEVRTHVWGADLSGTLQGAGGVGGLLATVIHNGPDAGVFFPVYDGNGNVMGYVRGADGLLVAQYEYGPFGELLRATGPLSQTFNPLFSTKYHDWETGLYYYGYRYYNPTTGRWLNHDPIREMGGINLYAYVLNDPLNLIDPYGLHWTDYIPDFLVAPDTVNFAAGLGDHLSFGLTDYAREGYGINDVVDKCSGAYGAGTATGVAFDFATTGGSLALSKNAAKVSARQLAKDRRTARKVLDLATGDGQFAHHVNPLKGHPGGAPTLFPTAGLPSWLKNHPGNLQALNAAEHAAAHQALQRAEALARGMGLANPAAAAARTGLSAGRCGCN